MAVRLYVVLNDNDTFSELEGCKLVAIDDEKLPEDQMDDLNDGRMKDIVEYGDTPAVTVRDLSKALRKSPLEPYC